MTFRLPLACGLAVAFLALLPPPLTAQLAQGELRGTVTDQSNAVLPGVTVTAVHVETGTSRVTVTAENGSLPMPVEPPRPYKRTVVPGARGNLGSIQAGASGSDAARYQMDGLSVTGQGTGGETQSYSQEVVGEVQVLTNRYDAEYGRVTGAVINAVTKAGSNIYHGSDYYYLRDD